MKTLSKRYEEICNEYLDLFCKKHEVYYDYWVADQVGGIIEISEENSRGILYWHSNNLDQNYHKNNKIE